MCLRSSLEAPHSGGGTIWKVKHLGWMCLGLDWEVGGVGPLYWQQMARDDFNVLPPYK